MHWGKGAPGQHWMLDIPAGVRRAAGALCKRHCRVPRSHHKDGLQCSAAHGGLQPESLDSAGGWSPNCELPGPRLHKFEKARIGHGLNHARESGAV